MEWTFLAQEVLSSASVRFISGASEHDRARESSEWAKSFSPVEINLLIDKNTNS